MLKFALTLTLAWASLSQYCLVDLTTCPSRCCNIYGICPDYFAPLAPYLTPDLRRCYYFPYPQLLRDYDDSISFRYNVMLAKWVAVGAFVLGAVLIVAACRFYKKMCDARSQILVLSQRYNIKVQGGHGAGQNQQKM